VLVGTGRTVYELGWLWVLEVDFDEEGIEKVVRGEREGVVLGWL
jgi:hypothetical protein